MNQFRKKIILKCNPYFVLTIQSKTRNSILSLEHTNAIASHKKMKMFIDHQKFWWYVFTFFHYDKPNIVFLYHYVIMSFKNDIYIHSICPISIKNNKWLNHLQCQNNSMLNRSHLWILVTSNFQLLISFKFVHQHGYLWIQIDDICTILIDLVQHIQSRIKTELNYKVHNAFCFWDKNISE